MHMKLALAEWKPDVRRVPKARNAIKSASAHVIVLVTTPDAAVARRLARAALDRRLIACANILPRIESMYWWQGEIGVSREHLMMMKSRKPLLAALEALVRELHPYDTPEFLALPLTSGSRRYLDWFTAETSG